MHKTDDSYYGFCTTLKIIIINTTKESNTLLMD